MSKRAWIQGLGILFFATASFSHSSSGEEWEHVVAIYCLDCHDHLNSKGGINMESWLDGDFVEQAANWERALRQIDAQLMPPA